MKKIKTYTEKITIPHNVNMQKKQGNLFISGVLGFTQLNLHKLDPHGMSCIKFNLQEKSNSCSTNKELIFSCNCKKFFTCACSIIKNKIIGVSSGFLVSIRIIGVGYRAEITHTEKNDILCVKAGYSHDFKYIIPTSVKIFLVEPTLIYLYGIEKNQITQIAAKIKQMKPPSVYKGKGIKLENENILLKIGKRK